MPAPKKKKSAKVLLAEAEAALVATREIAAAREAELGATITRLAATVTECKTLIVTQQRDVEESVDAREKSLRVALAASRARVAQLEDGSMQALRAEATAATDFSERALLRREIAELMASREHAERGHAIEKAAFANSLMQTRNQLEEVFRETLAKALETERRKLASQMGSDAVAGALELHSLRKCLAENSKELAAIFLVAEERDNEITRLVRPAYYAGLVAY